MSMKGFGWFLPAIGIIIVVEILVFSLAFTKVSIVQRETVDANVVFEGDTLESYARAIDDSVQLSVAQALYDMYSKNTDVWDSYGASSVPSKEDVNKKLESGVTAYMTKFLAKYAAFPPAVEVPSISFPSDVGTAKAVMERTITGVSLSPEFVLTKSAFDTTEYSRKFVAESNLTTFYGEMMDDIRAAIGQDVFGKAALQGVNDGHAACTITPLPDKRMDKSKDTSKYGQESYLGDKAACTGGFGSADPYIIGYCVASGTESVGDMFWCSTDKIQPCDSENPNSPLWTQFKDSAPPTGQKPTDDLTYTDSHHGYSITAAEQSIKDMAAEHLFCLEDNLDQKTTDYTVSFDKTLKVGSDVTNQCQTVFVGYCNCGSLGLCPDPGLGTADKRWGCNQFMEKTCDSGHFVSAQAAVRYQEDGFVYNQNPAPDSENIKFQVAVGNKDTGGSGLQSYPTPTPSK